MIAELPYETQGMGNIDKKAKGAAEMYLQILKKDLKRKKTMNVILLIL